MPNASPAAPASPRATPEDARAASDLTLASVSKRVIGRARGKAQFARCCALLTEVHPPVPAVMLGNGAPDAAPAERHAHLQAYADRLATAERDPVFGLRPARVALRVVP